MPLLSMGHLGRHAAALCKTARLTSSDGPNIRAFRKIEYVGGEVTPWLRPEIHPNQATEHDRSDLCKTMIKQKRVCIPHIH